MWLRRGQVKAQVIPNNGKITRADVRETILADPVRFADEHQSFSATVECTHKAVRRSEKRFAYRMMHPNGGASARDALRCGFYGIYQSFSSRKSREEL